MLVPSIVAIEPSSPIFVTERPAESEHVFGILGTTVLAILVLPLLVLVTVETFVVTVVSRYTVAKVMRDITLVGGTVV